MRDFSHIQVLLLNWIKHFGIRNREQIRIACKKICATNRIDEQYAVLKLLYPLLNKGFVEFVGNDRYQVSPPLLLSYPKSNTVVGVNLTANQKTQLKDIKFQEDIWGTVRFSSNNIDTKELSGLLDCKHQTPDAKSLSQFPKIKSIITSFDVCTLRKTSMMFYDVYSHKWVNNNNKEIGICKIGGDSLIHYLKINDKYVKIPSNIYNPDGRLLAECFQACSEREDIFFYNLEEKTLTVKNLHLPILIERILRLYSLHRPCSIDEKLNWDVIYPNIPMQMIKYLDRIFDTKTKITNG